MCSIENIEPSYWNVRNVRSACPTHKVSRTRIAVSVCALFNHVDLILVDYLNAKFVDKVYVVFEKFIDYWKMLASIAQIVPLVNI